MQIYKYCLSITSRVPHKPLWKVRLGREGERKIHRTCAWSKVEALERRSQADSWIWSLAAWRAGIKHEQKRNHLVTSGFKGSPGNHEEEIWCPLAVALSLLRHDSGDTGQGHCEENPVFILSEVKGDFSVEATRCSFPLKQGYMIQYFLRSSMIIQKIHFDHLKSIKAFLN